MQILGLKRVFFYKKNYIIINRIPIFANEIIFLTEEYKLPTNLHMRVVVDTDTVHHNSSNAIDLQNRTENVQPPVSITPRLPARIIQWSPPIDPDGLLLYYEIKLQHPVSTESAVKCSNITN